MKIESTASIVSPFISPEIFRNWVNSKSGWLIITEEPLNVGRAFICLVSDGSIKRFEIL